MSAKRLANFTLWRMLSLAVMLSMVFMLTGTTYSQPNPLRVMISAEREDYWQGVQSQVKSDLAIDLLLEPVPFADIQGALMSRLSAGDVPDMAEIPLLLAEELSRQFPDLIFDPTAFQDFWKQVVGSQLVKDGQGKGIGLQSGGGQVLVFFRPENWTVDVTIRKLLEKFGPLTLTCVDFSNAYPNRVQSQLSATNFYIDKSGMEYIVTNSDYAQLLGTGNQSHLQVVSPSQLSIALPCLATRVDVRIRNIGGEPIYISFADNLGQVLPLSITPVVAEDDLTVRSGVGDIAYALFELPSSELEVWEVCYQCYPVCCSSWCY
jgi:hypothetical protein